MLPLNSLSSVPMPSTFMYPDGIVLGKITEDYEMGGIALQDTSRGLQYQPWYGFWDEDDNTAYLVPNFISAPIPIFTQADVFEFGFTFDQNMRWCAGVFLTDGTFQLRWFDSSVGNYVITNFTGLTSFRLTLDDKRERQINIGATDILFTYIRNNNLYVREQRDRYTVEYLLQSDLPNNLRITNFGMNERYRVQWRMRYRRPGELLPWLL